MGRQAIGKSNDEADGDNNVEVRQSHSSKEASEQDGLAPVAEPVERRGLTERKSLQ